MFGRRTITIILLILFLFTTATASPLTDFALEQLDKPYRHAAVGPDSFDCSGFVCYCVEQSCGIELPHNAYQIGYCEDYEKIEDINDLQEGDILFFNTITDNDLCDHAAIYLGSNEFIHCSSRKRKVIISQLIGSYYEPNFSWARRVDINGE